VARVCSDTGTWVLPHAQGAVNAASLPPLPCPIFIRVARAAAGAADALRAAVPCYPSNCCRLPWQLQQPLLSRVVGRNKNHRHARCTWRCALARNRRRTPPCGAWRAKHAHWRWTRLARAARQVWPVRFRIRHPRQAVLFWPGCTPRLHHIPAPVLETLWDAPLLTRPHHAHTTIPSPTCSAHVGHSRRNGWRRTGRRKERRRAGWDRRALGPGGLCCIPSYAHACRHHFVRPTTKTVHWLHAHPHAATWHMPKPVHAFSNFSYQVALCCWPLARPHTPVQLS